MIDNSSLTTVALTAAITGKPSIFVPAAKIRELMLAQEPVQAPLGAFTVTPTDVRLEKGKIILRLELSSDITAWLALAPVPPLRAALAANELAGRIISLEPSLEVEIALEPYLEADKQEVFAPVADYTMHGFKPLNGIPLGNFATGLVGTVAGKTYSAAGSAARGVGSVASSAGSAVGRVASTATKPVRWAAFAAGGKLSGLVPGRFKRTRKAAVVEEEPVATPVEVAAVTSDEADDDENRGLTSLVIKLLNVYQEERPAFVIPKEYNGTPIAGVVRDFQIEEKGIRFFLDVDENPTYRSYRKWFLGAAAATAAVAGEWWWTSTLLWF